MWDINIVFITILLLITNYIFPSEFDVSGDDFEGTNFLLKIR